MPLGLANRPGWKFQYAVILLPVVVDHQHARREAMVDDVAGVSANAVLPLVVDQLDPGVVLGLAKSNSSGIWPLLGKNVRLTY